MKFFLASKTVQAQLAIILAALVALIDALVSREADAPFPTVVVGTQLSAILMACVAIAGRFAAKGPLTMRRGK